jgi:hypothetical protein
MTRTRYRVDRIKPDGSRLKFAWADCYAGASQIVTDQKSIDRMRPRERAKYEIMEVRR